MIKEFIDQKNDLYRLKETNRIMGNLLSDARTSINIRKQKLETATALLAQVLSESQDERVSMALHLIGGLS